MKPREVIDRSATPDGEVLELAKEAGHFVLRLAGVPLMSSATHGSEEAMALAAAECLGARASTATVLVGGLGMGFTLRAALDAFGPQAKLTVAELLEAVVRYNRDIFGDLAQRPLDDPRVTLHAGDVRKVLGVGRWDAILLDVDNGPEAFTTRANGSLYGREGVQVMAQALKPGGVIIIWSAHQSPTFERTVRAAGLHCEARPVRARPAARKGPRHTLFLLRSRRVQIAPKTDNGRLKQADS